MQKIKCEEVNKPLQYSWNDAWLSTPDEQEVFKTFEFCTAISFAILQQLANNLPSPPWSQRRQSQCGQRKLRPPNGFLELEPRYIIEKLYFCAPYIRISSWRKPLQTRSILAFWTGSFLDPAWLPPERLSVTRANVEASDGLFTCQDKKWPRRRDRNWVRR